MQTVAVQRKITMPAGQTTTVQCSIIRNICINFLLYCMIVCQLCFVIFLLHCSFIAYGLFGIYSVALNRFGCIKGPA